MATKSKTTTKKLTATERAESAEVRAARAEARLLRITQKQESIVTKQVRGFVDFLREQSVVGLAIGLVLGTQAKVLVDQLVLSFMNPLIGLLLPGEGTLKQKTFELTLNGKTAQFGWGAFVNSFISFIIVAAVVYYVFKGLRLDKLDKPQKDK
ncbi:MAG TPA: MscL family protein [Candidatus Saccharimonadales bacterium]|nr:MscL family protein [Candidatus Saccharimonadales bacterium]